MAKENRFEQVMKRIRTGLTTCFDEEWLRSYYETLELLVTDYQNQLREALDKIELLEYYQNCNE